jgi:hypothetical protein
MSVNKVLPMFMIEPTELTESTEINLLFYGSHSLTTLR